MSKRIEDALIASLKYFAANIAAYHAAKSYLAPMIAQFEAIQVEPDWNSDYLSIYTSGDRAQLVKIVRILRTNGYKADNKPAINSAQYSSWYRNADNTRRVYLTLSSTVCRVKQVGVEIKEVPIYETVCE